MPLRILKASAGSGKTYSLTESYIRYCLDEKSGLDFTNILAITFTNKASGEMKDRIIGLLHTLSDQPSKYPGTQKLCQDLDMTVMEIQAKCQLLLNRILKKFDLFTITTIDSFFTRLYGSMTLDLFGDPPRDITFDEDKALTSATNKLIEATQKDKELREVVIDLLEEKIREGDGVGLQNSLKKLGKELFNDEFLQLRDRSHYITPAKDFHRALTQSVDYILFNVDQYKDSLIDLLDAGGMDHKNFYRGFTESILNKESPLDLYKLASFQRLSDPEQWFVKKDYKEMSIRVEPIRQDLQALGQAFNDYVNDHYRKYATYSVVLENYAAYRVLRFLDQAVQDYLNEQQLIFLSDINLNIHRHLSGEDSMIVYEKLGQRLNTIMIDEFQDTSQIQWDNLKPLIRNSLAEGNPNLVVGDVKQAIYRFRNGNWEIMEIQVPEFQKEWLESGEQAIENLPVNWRSRPEIVSFNNDFFKNLSESLSEVLVEFQEEQYPGKDEMKRQSMVALEIKTLAQAPRQIYGGSCQQIAEKNQDKTGYVEINYWPYEKGTEKEKTEEERMKWLKDRIDDLYQDGFSGDDIGILARGKKDLSTLSEYLTRWSEEAPYYRFSSEDSLKLDLSVGVQLLIAGLKMKAGVNTVINQMVYDNYLIKLKKQYSAESARPDQSSTWEQALPTIGSKETNFQNSGIEQLTMFFESLIDEAGLTNNKGQWPYLLSFMEEVRKFEIQNGPDVFLFLEEWEQRIRDVKIQMSDDEGKIRLYTIHKSKGLEFEVVLLPFGEWDFEVSGQQNTLWVEDSQDEMLKLAGPLPVSYKNDLQYTSFNHALIKEYLRNVIDHLNLLYVAMTRPRQRLYIRLQEQERKEKKKTNDFVKPVTNTLDLFHMVFENLNVGTITKGVKLPKSSELQSEDLTEKEILDTYHLRHKPLSLHLRPSFDGSSSESIGQGLIVHRMLEDIKYRQDIEAAVSKAILAGDVKERDRVEWTEKLRDIVEFEPVKDFFNDDWRVYNEKSIMVVGGGEYRPDRIQENGKEYIVIDYKTGAINPVHHKQIRNYKTIIEHMVGLPVRSFIYYPLLPDLVEVV